MRRCNSRGINIKRWIACDGDGCMEATTPLAGFSYAVIEGLAVASGWLIKYAGDEIRIHQCPQCAGKGE